MTPTLSSGTVTLGGLPSIGSLVPSVTITQVVASPDFTKVNMTVPFATTVQEIQNVTITTSDGLLFGGINIDWNASGIPVYFRADESAEDFETKLESLPTVGDVSVTRSIVQSATTGAFLGYCWTVTFVSNQGDLPQLQLSLTPVTGLPISGNSLSVTTAVVRKGSYFGTVTTVSGLTEAAQYSLQVVPVNAKGVGASTSNVQNDGMGVIPLSLSIIGESSKPSIASIEAASGSQLAIQVTPPADNGGSVINKFVVEHTTNSTGFFDSSRRSISFRMYNKAGNDTEGFWKIKFEDSVSTDLPWGATADQVAFALNSFPALAGMTVTSAPTTPHYGQGFVYTLRSYNEVGSLEVDFNTIGVDLTDVTSKSLTQSIYYDQIFSDNQLVPVDYSTNFIYGDCNNIQTGKYSSHQVVSITSATADAPGTGSFKLNFGDKWSDDYQSTDCMPFTVTADALKTQLLSLRFSRQVFVETHKRNTGSSTGTTVDYHVHFEGLSPELDWPYLRADPNHLGITQGSVYASSCTAKQFPTTSVKVTTVSDNYGCINGVQETQAVILEATTSASGYFYGGLMGATSRKRTSDC